MFTKETEREFLRECIRLYRDLPALWKIKSKEYTDRHKKNESYNILLDKFKEEYPEADKEFIKKKINALRTNYRKEKKKIIESQNSRSSSHGIYKPTLWYFEEMMFLDDVENPYQSIIMPGEDEDSTQSTMQEDDWAFEQKPVIIQHETPYNYDTTKRQKIDRQERDCQKQRESEYDLLAKSWVNDLAKMDQTQEIFARKAINDILLEGRLGTLHRYSIQINVNTTASIPSTSGLHPYS